MSKFVFDPAIYQRDFDIVGNYAKSAAELLSLATGDPIDQCRAYVNKKLATDWQPKDPVIHSFARAKPHSDRHVKKSTLRHYLKWIRKFGHVLSPSFICYANPSREESFTAGFIRLNLANRSKVKKKMQQAKLEQQEDLAAMLDTLQSNFKIRNNSISGAHSSAYNSLYYTSAHTSLTSITRTITSYANATNEKFLFSNRHYHNPDVTFESIAFTTSRADMGWIQTALTDFNLVPPTVEQTLKVIFDSTSLYWHDEDQENLIRTLVGNMTYLQRSALVYIGDLHSLHSLNDGSMRRFYNSFMKAPQPVTDKAEQKAVVDASTDNDQSLATLLSIDFIAGIKPFNLPPEKYAVWVGYLKQINETLGKYESLIRAFFATKVLPNDIFNIPTVKRKSVLGSDTDSSIFTTEHQVEWFLGKIDFSHQATRVSAVTSFLVSEVVKHTLAFFSTQIGVEDKELYRLSMKSEIYSKGMLNTAVTKTYAMMENAEEGNLYKVPELVVKGVLLKAAKIPVPVRNEIDRFARYIIDMPYQGETNNPLTPASIIATIEHQLYNKLIRGNSDYLKTEQIKTPETYGAGEKNNHIIAVRVWNILFGDKYGYCDQLPTESISVNVQLDKMKKIEAWVKSFAPEKWQPLLEYFQSIEKTTGFNSFFIPLNGIKSDGTIPKEFIEIADIRKIIYSTMQPFYIMANALYLNVANERYTRFFSDDISEEEALKYLPEGYDIHM